VGGVTAVAYCLSSLKVGALSTVSGLKDSWEILFRSSKDFGATTSINSGFLKKRK